MNDVAPLDWDRRFPSFIWFAIRDGQNRLFTTSAAMGFQDSRMLELWSDVKSIASSEGYVFSAATLLLYLPKLNLWAGFRGYKLPLPS